MTREFKEHYHRKPLHCPWCNHEIRESMDINEVERRPSGGDISLCFECGRFSIFLGLADLRKPTPDEAYKILADPVNRLAWLAWKLTMVQMKDERRGKHRR